MTDDEIKQAILGFTDFFKAITGNQNLEIPSEIAEKCGIQAQADGEYITQSAGDEIRQKNYDLISRQAAIDKMQDLEYEDIKAYGCSIPEGFDGKRAIEALKNLPSIQPQPKTGHWEWVQYDSNPNIGNWHCSECRTIIPHMPEETDNTPIYKWCPICGAKIIDPQEGAIRNDLRSM